MPEKLRGLVESIEQQLVRWIFLEGGRSSGKSWNGLRALLVVSMSREMLIVACRDTEKSIKNSIHRLIKNQIVFLGVSHHWTITNESIYCHLTGSEFVFIGLMDNPEKIRSFESADVCLLEECANTPRYVFDVVIPTIRKSKSIIMMIWNPDWEDDYVNDFIKNIHEYEHEGVYHRHINYIDNPFCDEISINQAEREKKLDYESYEHIWLGKALAHAKQQVFRGCFEVREFDVKSFKTDRRSRDYIGEPEIFLGVAWGYSQRPTATIAIICFNNNLYIDYCGGGIGLEIDDVVKAVNAIPYVSESNVMASPHQPATLKNVASQVEAMIYPAEKWEGDVIDAIIHLRGCYNKIIIRPGLDAVIDNFERYWWDMDEKTGDILDTPIDRHNEYFNAIRHALSDRIRGAL